LTVSDPGLIFPESACRWPQVFHTQGIRLRPMTLFNPVFNCLTPIVIKRLKTQADEGLTPADEAGSVVLRQPPASKLANLFRIDAWDHALGLVTRQVGGRVTEHPPGGWLGPRTRSLREGNQPVAIALLPSRGNHFPETVARVGQSCRKLSMSGSCGWSFPIRLRFVASSRSVMRYAKEVF
jgi:hypothetical protein